jgi:hypothetical protein
VRRTSAALLTIALPFLCAQPAAHAGRSSFAWLLGTETAPERGVELETWLIEENGKGDAEIDRDVVVWGPAIGITDQLELALPMELQIQEVAGATDTQLTSYGAEVRMRLASPDPLEAGRFVPLVRAGAKRLVGVRDQLRTEANAVLTADLTACLRAAIDVGGVLDIDEEDSVFTARPAVGINYHVGADVRLGAEAFASLKKDDDRSTDWMVVGPNLAWTHGRFWLAATVGVGLFGIDWAPRLNWAVAF